MCQLLSTSQCFMFFLKPEILQVTQDFCFVQQCMYSAIPPSALPLAGHSNLKCDLCAS